MTMLTAVSRLMLQGRDPQAPVAWSTHKAFGWEDFLQDVARISTVLASQPARRCALYTQSAYWFAAGLMAMFQARKCVLLLPNPQPGALALLQDEDLLVSDLPSLLANTGCVDPRNCSAGVADPRFVLRELDSALCPIEIYTSGTTGQAKCVHKTLAHFEAEIAVLESLWGRQLQGCRILASVSHQHVYGILFRILWPLCAGRAFADGLIEYPEQLVQAQDFPLALVSSPALLKRIANEPVLAVPGLFFSSGGPLDEQLNLNICQQWNAQIWEVFGSTETGGVAVRNRAQDAAWTLMPGVTASLAEGGLLQVDSRHVAAGEQVMGDRAELLPRRQLRLLGRADRIVKLEEKRISLTAIEARLGAHGWVANAHALVLPGQRELLAVVIELNPAGWLQLRQSGAPAIKKQLRDWLATELEPVTLPRKMRFVDTMPLTTQGKFSKTEIERLFADVTERVELPEVLVQETGLNRCRLELRVPENCCWFDGHFDAVPILSGVAQIDWVMALAAQYLGITGRFAGVEALKFQNIIRPGDELALELEHAAEKQRLYFSMQSHKPLSSGRIVLAGDNQS